MLQTHLSIGDVSKRSGLPISTLHFYERKGLIAAERSAGNHRLYPRAILRRIAVIKVAQSAGIPLAEIANALSILPLHIMPTADDWARLAIVWHADLTCRISLLTSLRDKMTLCIGCGCLSVERCPLMNEDDHLGRNGSGARLLLE